MRTGSQKTEYLGDEQFKIVRSVFDFWCSYNCLPVWMAVY
jgi:hypothetical protein